jgi:hypothetical protein
VLIVVLSALWKLRERTVGSPRHLAAIACFVLVALQVPLAWSNWNSDDGGDFASRESLPADLAALQRVPANAQVYGVAWYSAPDLALYSGRRFDNIATKTPLQLAAASPVFLALDMQAQNVGAAQYWLDRYSNREIARSSSLRLVELDATTPLDPFRAVSVDDGAVLSRVDFRADDYAYVFGFQNREGDGWRWASADAEVLLRYRGEREFNVDVYVPPLRSYRFKKEVGITVWIGACRLGTFRQNENRRERWWFPAANCPLQQGERVAVRLTSDNLYESRDERQLAYIVHSLGFAEPLASTSTGPADSR